MSEHELARIIWDASRADEGTISATGANIVARAILASDELDAVRRKAEANVLTEAADWIDSTRSLKGIASAALDPGKAFAVAVLRDRAAAMTEA